MAKNKKIEVKGTAITIYKGDTEDYISLTDIARYKDTSNMDTIIQNWLRNRNTIELLGFWSNFIIQIKVGDKGNIVSLRRYSTFFVLSHHRMYLRVRRFP